MPIRLHNTLTRRVEPFEPLKPGEVTMYVCGPTVYDDPHIGHARSAHVFDVLRRYLEFSGYTVRFVRNVTDVDDKIIEKARQELGAGGGGWGSSELAAKCREVAERYLARYRKAMDRLGIRRPDVEPKATEHINTDPAGFSSMTDLIAKLLLDQAAYESGGDVYFAVRSFAGYGKLSNRTLDELQAGARVEPGEHKRDPLDFALWKQAKPDEPVWNSPWGAGRPGWHIECSAMSTKYLGNEFDIHGGGVDLVFPHHENEIAQAQAAGKPFARYWIHNGLITVKGEKMSKSLGNFTTIDDAFEACHSDKSFQADVLKMFFLGAHYRSPLDYSPHNIQSARIRFTHYSTLCFEAAGYPRIGCLSEELSKLKVEFVSAMDDDLNTPRALAVLDKVTNIGRKAVEELNIQEPLPEQVAVLRANICMAADLVMELGKVLGLFTKLSEVVETILSPELPPEVTKLLQQREQARKAKDFKTSDQLREQIEAMGFTVKDRASGAPQVTRKL